MFKNNKGIVGLTTFSLIILLMISLFSLTFYYFNSNKLDSTKLIETENVQNSLNSFRSSLIQISSVTNSSYSYSDSLTSNTILLTLENKTINGFSYYDNFIVNITIPSLSLNFCSNYSFYSKQTTNLNFNGSCISVN